MPRMATPVRGFVKAALYSGLMLAGIGATAAQANYVKHEQGKAFIDEMVTKHGFKRESLVKLFEQAERKDGILESIAKPAERVLTWADYRRIFITQKRIDGGRAFLKQHQETLKRAEATYGVPVEIIVAIIGVETSYGENKGNHRVIDALSTLAFDYPPRSKFFRSELEHYLLLTRSQGFDPLEIKGSYAGAMGYGQFISSSYRAYAVDFDGDKVADILNNPVDAIGSVANYFNKHKWRKGEAVVLPVTVKGDGYKKLLQKDLPLRHKVADLQRAGVQFKATVDAKQSARMVELEGQDGLEHWVGLNNFYVITRYNHSPLYAMAVYQLSREILNEQPTSR
jgi:membrane-bound lytic murein transglycosylase B